MSKFYVVEQWSYKSNWKLLSKDERVAFFTKVGEAIQQMSAIGIHTLGFGHVDKSIDKALSAYDFWAIWEMPNQDARNAFLAGVAASGWYDYFEHCNTSSMLDDPANIMAEHIAV